MNKNLVYLFLATLCFFPSFSMLHGQYLTGYSYLDRAMDIAPQSSGELFIFQSPDDFSFSSGVFSDSYLFDFNANYLDQTWCPIYNDPPATLPFIRAQHLREDGNRNNIFAVDHEGPAVIGWASNPALPGFGTTLVKMDSLRTPLWSALITATGPNARVFTTGTVLLPNGDIYASLVWRGDSLLPNSLPAIASNVPGEYAAAILKCTSNGQIQWVQTLHASSASTTLYPEFHPTIWVVDDAANIFLKAKADSGQTVYVGNSAVSFTATSPDDYFIVSLDSSGTPRWAEKEFAQNPGWDAAKSRDIQLLDDGTMLASFTHANNATPGTYQHLIARFNYGSAATDSILFTASGSDLDDGGFGEMELLASGNIAVFGMFRDSLHINGVTYESAVGARTFIALLDTGLNILSTCMPDTSIIWEMDSTKARFGKNGKLYYARHYSDTPDKVVRVKTLGTNCAEEWERYFADFLLSAEPPQPEISFQVYPNPTTEKVSIQTGALSAGSTQVRIYNSTGQQVHARSFSHPGSPLSAEFDISHWPSGVYYIALENGGELVTKPFVKN